jgi:hypothetical protein
MDLLDAESAAKERWREEWTGAIVRLRGPV